jgi:hypothetical protein
VRITDRIRRLEIVSAPGELPITACFAKTREDGEQVTGPSLDGSTVPTGLTMPEFVTWAAERGLHPLMISFVDPVKRGSNANY